MFEILIPFLVMFIAFCPFAHTKSKPKPKPQPQVYAEEPVIADVIGSIEVARELHLDPVAWISRTGVVVPITNYVPLQATWETVERMPTATEVFQSVVKIAYDGFLVGKGLVGLRTYEATGWILVCKGSYDAVEHAASLWDSFHDQERFTGFERLPTEWLSDNEVREIVKNYFKGQGIWDSQLRSDKDLVQHIDRDDSCVRDRNGHVIKDGQGNTIRTKPDAERWKEHTRERGK